jgi:hypothetical protein
LASFAFGRREAMVDSEIVPFTLLSRLSSGPKGDFTGTDEEADCGSLGLMAADETASGSKASLRIFILRTIQS